MLWLDREVWQSGNVAHTGNSQTQTIVFRCLSWNNTLVFPLATGTIECKFLCCFTEISYISREKNKVIIQQAITYTVEKIGLHSMHTAARKINTGSRYVRLCGYKGMHLITLYHKPACYVLFLPWLEFLSHVKKAHCTVVTEITVIKTYEITWGGTGFV